MDIKQIDNFTINKNYKQRIKENYNDEISVYSELLNGKLFNDIEIHTFNKKSGIYIISILNDYYKIGSSKNIKKRIITLERYYPFEIKIVYLHETECYRLLEEKLHKYFELFKIKNEWFKLDYENIENAKQICKEWETY